MKCWNCTRHVKTEYRVTEPFIRLRKSFCPTCERSDYYTTIGTTMSELKVALALYYDMSMREKDKRRNPYFNKARYTRIFNNDIAPKFTEDMHTISELLKLDGVDKGVY